MTHSDVPLVRTARSKSTQIRTEGIRIGTNYNWLKDSKVQVMWFYFEKFWLGTTLNYELLFGVLNVVILKTPIFPLKSSPSTHS